LSAIAKLVIVIFKIDRSELAEIFGDDEILERVLAGRNVINTSQAQALGERFKLSPQVFLNS
jgi:antitoxin component HigA of HigAB toxin-antitoxin module